MIRQANISQSAIIHAYSVSQNYGDAYAFAKLLSAQVKHPIILKYKSQQTHIAKMMGMSPYLFRRRVDQCLEYGFFSWEGDNMRLWSRNKDIEFKEKHGSKRNDYRITANPYIFRKLAQLKKHANKQIGQIKSKARKASKAQKTVRVEDTANPNYTIYGTYRSLTKVFGCKSPTTAKALLNQLSEKGLVKATLKKDEITRKECAIALTAGKKDVRKINGRYYIVATEIELLFDLKRQPFDPLTKISEYEYATYSSMGMTDEQIRTQLYKLRHSKQSA